ncbi:MAG: hypothetical protein ACI9CF_001848 [Candidatus Omnitrophota bacterium]|jgi:hypothetical protein
MLRSVKGLIHYKIQGIDAHIGHIVDLLVDDNSWVLRYLVDDTGHFFPGRKILISPKSIGEIDSATKTTHVKLDKKQVHNSPAAESHKPVSLQKQDEIAQYFGWPLATEWALAGGGVHHPTHAEEIKSWEQIAQKVGEEKESHLRSVTEVFGYAVEALDGRAGRLEDLIIDDASWNIQYLVVDIGSTEHHKHLVMISPDWVENVDWNEALIHFHESKLKIDQSPAFDATAPVNELYEQKLYDYYGKPFSARKKRFMDDTLI